MSFAIQILDGNNDIRIYDLTAATCPELSFASLVYPRAHLKSVQIDGLPLQQDQINYCPLSPNLEQIVLRNNGLLHPSFTSCSSTYRNLKYVSFANQDIVLENEPILPLSGKLKYLSLYSCSLQELYRSTFEGLSALQVLNISYNNISSCRKNQLLLMSSHLVCHQRLASFT